MEKRYQIRIPRVSLSSSGSSNRSCQQTNSSKTTDLETSGESEPEAVCSRGYASRSEMYTVRKAPKIGVGSVSTSASSSGGASNRSNYSLSSFLLSVKNLDHHRSTAETSRQSCCETTSKYIMSENNPNVILKSNFHNNCKQHQQQPTLVDNEAANKYPIYEHRWKMLQNIKSIAATGNLPSLGGVSSKLEHQQEKEVDEISTTSTKTNTNFTVISLNDSEERLTKSKGKAICRRSHQLTILIFIMTLIFIFVISFMLILMDMRNAKMPR